jgi:hypothetical protein
LDATPIPSKIAAGRMIIVDRTLGDRDRGKTAGSRVPLPKPGSGKNPGSRVGSDCFGLFLARWVSKHRFSEVGNLNPWEESGYSLPRPMRASAGGSGQGSLESSQENGPNDQEFRA